MTLKGKEYSRFWSSILNILALDAGHPASIKE